MRKHFVLKILAAAILSAVIVLLSCSSVFAAGNKKTYITDLSVSNTLMSDTYTVMPFSLNLNYDLMDTKETEKIYVAYTYGAERDAVTDVRVFSGYNANGIKVNGITYTPASSVNLNSGTDGTAIYLYYTKDSSAGEPVMALTTSAYRTDIETESYDESAIIGNGFEPVKNENNKPANLDLGREGLYLFLHELHKTVYKPYICNVHVASAADKKSAIFSLASSGCNYYVDEVRSDKNGYTVVGYDRTADASQAITSLRGVTSDSAINNSVTEGTTVYTLAEKISIDKESDVYLAYATGGNSPIYMLDTSAVFADQAMTVSRCAEINFRDSVINRYVCLEKEYKEALKNTKSLKSVNVPIANDNEKTVNLSIVFGGDESFVNAQIAKNMKNDVPLESETTAVEAYTGEPAYEEGDPIYFNDEETTGETETGSGTAASAFGKLGAVWIVSVVVFAGAAVTVLVIRKKKLSIDKNKERGK